MKIDLKEKSTEKLQGEYNALKVVTSILIGVLSVLFIVCIYGLIREDDNGFSLSLIVVPLALSSIIPVNFKKMKQIKAEIESRKTTQQI